MIIIDFLPIYPIYKYTGYKNLEIPNIQLDRMKWSSFCSVLDRKDNTHRNIC